MNLQMCSRCERDIMFATTRDNLRPLPLDPARRDRDDTDANIAVYRDHMGRLWARQLRRGESPEPFEWRAMPHFATCPEAGAPRARKRPRVKQPV